MIQYYILLSLTIGFIAVVYSIPKIVLISRNKKLFDVPNDRSAAKSATPTLGGIAIFAGFYTSLIVTLNSFNIQPIICLLLASVAMFLTGLKDDLIGMSPRRKLFFQILTVTYLIGMGDVRISNLHGVLGIYEIDPVSSSLLTLVAMVGIVNAYNLIDGIDGLAAGTGILISIVFGTLFILSEQTEYAIVAFSMTGSLIAFFFFNVFGRENKIFMGDTGSLTLGVVFAFLMVKYMDQPVGMPRLFASPGIVLSIMILPVTDTLRVMGIRLLQGRSPFSPDMNHIHHQLLRLNGNHHLHTSMTIIVSNLAVIAFACGFHDLIGTNLLVLIVSAAGFTLAAIPWWFNRLADKRKVDEELPGVRVIPLTPSTQAEKVRETAK